jgi:hypothetical protein
MKIAILLSLLVVTIGACATVSDGTLRLDDSARGKHPGAPCEYDDECGSRVCDAYLCRGPVNGGAT